MSNTDYPSKKGLTPRDIDFNRAIPKVVGVALIPLGLALYKRSMAKHMAPGFLQKFRITATSLSISYTGASVAGYTPHWTVDSRAGVTLNGVGQIREDCVYAVGALTASGAVAIMRPPSIGQVTQTLARWAGKSVKLGYENKGRVSDLPESIARGGFCLLGAVVIPQMVSEGMDLLKNPDKMRWDNASGEDDHTSRDTQTCVNLFASGLLTGGMLKAVPVLTSAKGPVFRLSKALPAVAMWAFGGMLFDLERGLYFDSNEWRVGLGQPPDAKRGSSVSPFDAAATIVLTTAGIAPLFSKPSFTALQFLHPFGAMAGKRWAYVLGVLGCLSVAGLGVTYAGNLSLKGTIEIDLTGRTISARARRDLEAGDEPPTPPDGRYLLNVAGLTTMLVGGAVMMTAVAWRRLLIGNLIMLAGSGLYQAEFIRCEMKNGKLRLSLRE